MRNNSPSLTAESYFPFLNSVCMSNQLASVMNKQANNRKTFKNTKREDILLKYKPLFYVMLLVMKFKAIILNYNDVFSFFFLYSSGF